MKFKTLPLIVMNLFSLLFLIQPSFSQDTRSPSKEWEFSLTPYLWLIDTDGDVIVKGNSQPINVKFKDAIDNLDFGAMGRFEAWKDKWGITLDAFYLNFEDDFRRNATEIDFNSEILMADFGLGYRVAEVFLGSSQNAEAEAPKPCMSFDLLGGGRYSYLKSDIKVKPLARLSKSNDWLEPFVGGRIGLQISDKWSFALRGDIGGFGIGSASDLTWNLIASVGYRLSRTVSFHLGYRILDIDYEKGSGAQKSGFDTQMQGLAFGISFHF